MDVGNIRAKLDAALDSSAFEKFDERLDKARQKAARKVEAKLGADFDSGAFVAYSKALDAAQAKAKRREAFKAELGADFDESAFREYERALVRTDAHTQRATSNVRGFGGAIGDANQRMQFFSRTMGLLKWPALITGAGGAAQALSALAGGAVGLTSALAPLSGALVAYPALFGAFGQASGVVALSGVGDLTEAVGGLNEKLDKQGEAYKRLSPQAQRFAARLDSLKKPIREIQGDVQRPLFDGLEKGLRRAEGVLNPFRRGMTRTAEVMGHLAERAGKLVGGKAFGRDLEKVMDGNARLLGRMGRAGMNLGNALRHVMVAAQPLVRWMGRFAVDLSKGVENAAKMGRESGKLAGFFDKTRRKIEQLVSIGGNLGKTFLDIGAAAAPLGNKMLRSFEDGADALAKFTSSAKGKGALEDFFKRIERPLEQAGKLAIALGEVFVELSQTPGLTKLIRMVRADLLPVMVDLVRQTTKAFGPPLIDFLAEAGRLFATFVGESGPLTLFVKGLTSVMGVLNKIFESSPAVKTAAVTLAGAFGVFQTIGLARAISQLAGFSKGLDTVKDAASWFKGTRIGEWIIGGITDGLAAGRSRLRSAAGRVKDLFRAGWDRIATSAAADWIGGLAGGIRTRASRVKDAARAALRLPGRLLSDVAGSAAGTWIGNLIGGVRGGAGRLKERMGTVMRDVAKRMGAILASVTAAAIVGGEAAAAGVTTLAAAIRKRLPSMEGKFRGIGRGIGKAIGVGIIAGVLTSLPELLKEVGSWFNKHGVIDEDGGGPWGDIGINPPWEWGSGYHGGVATEHGIESFQRGGVVTRGVRSRDTVRALLRRGEGVLVPEAVELLGGGPGIAAMNRASVAVPGATQSAGTPQRIFHQLLGLMAQGFNVGGNRVPVPVAAMAAMPTVVARPMPRLSPPARPSIAKPPQGGRSSAGGSSQPISGPLRPTSSASRPGAHTTAPVSAAMATVSAGESLNEAAQMREELASIYSEIAEISEEQAAEMAERYTAHAEQLTRDATGQAKKLSTDSGKNFSELRIKGEKESASLRDRFRRNVEGMRDDTTRLTEAVRDRAGERFAETRRKADKEGEETRRAWTDEIGKLPENTRKAIADVETKVRNGLGNVKSAVDTKAAEIESKMKAPFNAAENAAGTALSNIKDDVDKIVSQSRRAEKAIKGIPNKPGGKKARGGIVEGPPGEDQVPAWLTDGEYVIRPEVVDRLGERFFDVLNAGGFRMGGRVATRKRKRPKPPKLGQPVPTPWIDAAKALMMSDAEIAGLGAQSDYGLWEAPDVSAILDPLFDAYTGGDSKGHVVSDLWKGAFSGVGGLFDALYSGIAANDPNAAARAESSIFGGGGQGVLNSAIGMLSTIASTGSGIISGAQSSAQSVIDAIWGDYGIREAGRGNLVAGPGFDPATGLPIAGSALAELLRAQGKIYEGTATLTAQEAFDVAKLQYQIKLIKRKKGKLTGKDKQRIRDLKAGQDAILKAAGMTLSDEEGNLIGEIQSQIDSLIGTPDSPSLGAQDLAGASSAVQGILSSVAGVSDTVGSALAGFGSTDASRARSEYLAALDAGFEEVRGFQAGRANLMREFGSNFRGARGETTQTSARTFGAFGQRPEGSAESSGSAGPVTVNNYFQQPPPDPHIWSRGTLFELRAGV